MNNDLRIADEQMREIGKRVAKRLRDDEYDKYHGGFMSDVYRETVREERCYRRALIGR